MQWPTFCVPSAIYYFVYHVNDPRSVPRAMFYIVTCSDHTHTLCVDVQCRQLHGASSELYHAHVLLSVKPSTWPSQRPIYYMSCSVTDIQHGLVSKLYTTYPVQWPLLSVLFNDLYHTSNSMTCTTCTWSVIFTTRPVQRLLLYALLSDLYHYYHHHHHLHRHHHHHQWMALM